MGLGLKFSIAEGKKKQGIPIYLTQYIKILLPQHAIDIKMTEMLYLLFFIPSLCNLIGLLHSRHGSAGPVTLEDSQSQGFDWTGLEQPKKKKIFSVVRKAIGRTRGGENAQSR